MIEWKFSHEIKIILNFRRMIFWILSLYMSQKKILCHVNVNHLINRLIFFNVPAEMDKKANKLENAGARYEDVARKLITLENMVTIRNGYPRNGCSHRLPASCLHCARSIPENSEYYVTYSGSFIHENPNPTVIIFNRGPLDFATSAFFPCVPTTRVVVPLFLSKKKEIPRRLHLRKKKQKPVPLSNVPSWISTPSNE